MTAERRCTYFLSDAHLGGRFVADPAGHERRVAALLDSMAKDAKAVYLLGDMLDFWFEYRNVVPKGFTRFFAAIARLTDAGIPVYWFKGNHDMWTQGYLEQELGVTVIDDDLVTEIDGKTFYLSHGDACGPMKPSYKLLRGIFRNELCRRLGAALHPRILLGFGNWWSCHNRQRHHDATEPAYYMGDDKEPQMLFAREHAQKHPEVDHYVMGHRHIAASRPVPETNATLTILGDCFRGLTYARFDGQELHLKQNASAGL